MRYPLALLLSTCIGVLFNFKTIGRFVFARTNNNYFLKFVTVYGGIYFFNMILIKFLESFTNNFYLAGLVAMVPAAIIAFILNKFIVFRDRYETD